MLLIISTIAARSQQPLYINNPSWTSCNCWPHHCGCRPQRWCSHCCRYVDGYHYHAGPYLLPYVPYVPYIPWVARDDALREEGRREERKRQKRDRRHYPYVDITPALPNRGC